MINLIPQAEKKKMRKNFYYRLVVLLLITGSFSLFIALVAIVPSYFTVAVKKNIVDEKLDVQKKEPVPLPDQKTLLIIKDLNSKLDLVEGIQKNKFSLSEKVVNAVILKKIPGIKITDISYENNSSQGRDPKKSSEKVSIQGSAVSREALLLFRKALEDSPAFKQVDLPISNFVKGSDIRFYLNLIPS